MKWFPLGAGVGCMLCAVWHVIHGNYEPGTYWLMLGLYFKMDSYSA